MKKFLLSFLCLMTLFAANAQYSWVTSSGTAAFKSNTATLNNVKWVATTNVSSPYYGVEWSTKNTTWRGQQFGKSNASVVPFTLTAPVDGNKVFANKQVTKITINATAGAVDCVNLSVKVNGVTYLSNGKDAVTLDAAHAAYTFEGSEIAGDVEILYNLKDGVSSYTKAIYLRSIDITYGDPVVSGPVDYTPDFQDVELMAGDTHTLALGDKHPADMIFVSDNDNVATVTDEGVITAVAEGTATITCSWDADSNFNAGETEFTVTITPKVKVVYAPDFQNVTITEGRTLALALGEKHPVILFESSNESVATIDDAGVITALAVGETTISCLWGDADYEDGEAEFTVTVEKAPVVTDVTIVMKDVHGTTGNNALGEFTAKDITFIPAKNNGGTAPAYNNTAGDVRIYAKGSLEIKSTRNIVKIVFNISTAGLKRLAPITANVGTVAAQALGDVTVTWTGDANDIKFTVGDKANYGSDGSSKAGQFNFDSVVITYAPEAPKCPYTEEELTPIYSVGTVTFDENNQAKIEIPNNDLDGVKIYYKHVPAATENEVNLMSVDHADFTEATHNVENGTHDFTINGAGQVTYYGYHEATDTKGVERTFKVLEDGTTGVEGVEVDGDDAAVEYFNLQGVRVENPAAGGLYIRKQGSKVTKVIL